MATELLLTFTMTTKGAKVVLKKDGSGKTLLYRNKVGDGGPVLMGSCLCCIFSTGCSERITMSSFIVL